MQHLWRSEKKSKPIEKSSPYRRKSWEISFACISKLIKNNWKHHNTLVGFAMDHGCHEIDGGCGSHGLDMTEDINIVHLYKGYEGETK